MVNPDNLVPAGCATLADLARYRALQQPEQLAFTFLPDSDGLLVSLTYRELDQRSQAIAAQLQEMGLQGERALLLYPPGLDYLTAFLGCLYAGVVAVPAYPPRNRRNTPRILAVASDAEATIALTTSTIYPQVQGLAQATSLAELRWLTTDDIPQAIATDWQAPAIQEETLAFLQYTSGSTGTPKGVMLSHGNLLHNAAVTYQLMAHSPESRFVSWLPMYHDMGLIGGILQPLYGGFPCFLMAPASFLQHPYRWLKVISDYRGTTSGGPNFAYELCLRKVTPAQRQTLDLSCWTVAFNGAEPIRAETLERFAATFADCGFRPQAFYPCYGMAEATLMVSGGTAAALPKVVPVQSSALARHQIAAVEEAGDRPAASVRSLVGCGRTVPQQQLVIARPDLTRCPPEEIGEVWVSGPSVGQGYWHRPEETEQTFGAYLATGEGPFLRTGDLGFLQDGELVITGRAKDLIIVRGRNLYPQDIELTAEQSHPALRAGSGAAFSIAADEERLVVVQELAFRQQPDLAEVSHAIRQAIAQVHEIQVYAVVLIKPGTIPKTSSGKIQRRACRAGFLAGELAVVGHSVLALADAAAQPGANQPTSQDLLAIAPEDRRSEWIANLQQQVAEALRVAPAQIDPQQPLIQLGLDSLAAFDLKSRLETNCGVAVSIPDLFQGASVAQLVQQILDQVTSAAPSRPKLQPIPRTGQLPLGLAQERLWFLDQLEPGNPFYNVAIAVQLTGALHAKALAQSFNELVKRHEVLRTSFADVDGHPVQLIHPSLDLPLSVVDVPALHSPSLSDSPATKQDELQQFILQASQHPFNLSQAPLLRATLLRLAETEHLLLLTMHHIIADGWSVRVLLQELAALYNAYSQAQPSPLADLPIQYADFAFWQRQWLQEGFQTQLDYWKQQLKGTLPVLQLGDQSRSAIQNFAGKQQGLVFSQELAEAVKTLSRKAGVTVYMALLAAFKVLLYSYTGQPDLLVGSPTASRQPETAGLIGFFINTLVLRTNLSGNPSFQELLNRVRDVALGAYAHQDLPFEKLVEELQPERSLSHNPLFQVMFIFQNVEIPVIDLPGLTLRPWEVDSGTSKFDLKLSLWETPDGLHGSFEYQSDRFDADTIARMATRLEKLLHQVVAQPEIQLTDLVSRLTAAEQQQQHQQARELEAANLQKLKLARRKAIHAS